ncbi:MAG TPA: hypothetical protein VJR89_02565 [Polyangiales bacterium]|nr:hypothetical protein [Polyangiales bacterium]
MHWTANLTKAQMRELGRVAGLAYERELSAALSELDVYFQRWRAAEIEAHDVSDAIHKFHQGASRKLWSRYNGGDDYLVAVEAIATGVVERHEVAADLLQAMQPSFALFEYKSSSMPPKPG